MIVILNGLESSSGHWINYMVEEDFLFMLSAHAEVHILMKLTSLDEEDEESGTLLSDGYGKNKLASDQMGMPGEKKDWIGADGCE